MEYFIASIWKSYLIFCVLPDLPASIWANGEKAYSFKAVNFPNDGYFCPADGLLTLDIPPWHCKLHCLQMQNCAALNYNKTSGLCVLLHAPCTFASRWEGVEYTMFTGRNHDQCLKWVPPNDIKPTSNHAVASPEGYLACRLQIGNGIFLGFYHTSLCWVTDGSIQHDSRNNPTEILTIPPECTVGWVDYTAGTPLPPSVVVAGHSYTGKNLYVAMVTFHSPLLIVTGYYNVGTGLGYCTGFGKTYHFSVLDLMTIL